MDLGCDVVALSEQPCRFFLFGRAQKDKEGADERFSTTTRYIFYFFITPTTRLILGREKEK
jgi:hypothetical protein